MGHELASTATGESGGLFNNWKGFGFPPFKRLNRRGTLPSIHRRATATQRPIKFFFRYGDFL